MPDDPRKRQATTDSPIGPAPLPQRGSEIYLGNYLNLGTGETGRELTYTGERHLVLFGPNGSGKSTRILDSNLLRVRDRSLVVIDPKGELAAVTADYRRTLGEVVILNPFDVLGLGSAGFNPLAALDSDSPTFIDDATGIGEALIKIEEKDPHWSESAEGLVVSATSRDWGTYVRHAPLLTFAGAASYGGWCAMGEHTMQLRNEADR